MKSFSTLITETSKFKRSLHDIDQEDEGFKYYVGYIRKRPRKKNYSWIENGHFKGFNDHKSVLIYIDQLKDEKIPESDIEIFPPSRYNEIKRARQSRL